MTPSPGLISNCLTYFVHLNEKQHPIPGTMFSKMNSAKKDHGLGCREAILPTTQMTIPAGKKQCFGRRHFRYFYKIDKLTGKILPNSFWEQIGKPNAMCTGHYSILEYIVYK